MGAPAARVAELAQHWSRAGHNVSILTGFPNHPTGVVPAEWRSRLRRLTFREQAFEVDVFRTWLWALPNRKSHERMRNYASFCLSAAFRGMTVPRADAIIATSPQLLVGLAGWWIAFSRQIPFVFEVRDLWPESLTAVGIGSQDSLLHHTLAGIARFLYEHADRIVVVTPAFKDRLIEDWNVPAEKISSVENGIETELFAPVSDRRICELRKELNADGKFVVSYIGTMGNAHGLETTLEAASQLQDHYPQVLFLLIGEGAEKQRIKTLAESRGPQALSLPRSTNSRENSRFDIRIGCMPGFAEENRCFQDGHPDQNARIHVLCPPGDTRCGWPGSSDCRSRRCRNCNRSREFWGACWCHSKPLLQS